MSALKQEAKQPMAAKDWKAAHEAAFKKPRSYADPVEMARMEKSKGRVSIAEAKKAISPKKRIAADEAKSAWKKFKDISPEDIEKFGDKVKKTVDASTKKSKEAAGIYKDAFGRYKKYLGEAGSTAKKVVSESRPYIETAQEAAKKLEPVYKDQRKRVIDAVKKEKGWWNKLAKRAAKLA